MAEADICNIRDHNECFFVGDCFDLSGLAMTGDREFGYGVECIWNPGSSLCESPGYATLVKNAYKERSLDIAQGYSILYTVPIGREGV